MEKELDTDRDFDTKFDTSNYAFHRPIPRWKLKKVIGLMKHELGAKIIKEFFVLIRAKTYKMTYRGEDKIEKGTKKCVIKRKLKKLKIIKTA